MEASPPSPAGSGPGESETKPEADPAASESSEDEIIATLSDYREGTLPRERRAEVEAKLASDPSWQAIDAELRAELPPLGKLGKVAAPEDLGAAVTEAIHRRSGGRFFGKRTLGDRLPTGVLLVIAAVLLGAMTLVWCRSTTGSLSGPRGTEAPRPAPSEPLAPRP
jgi:anti-sigma factor RsiW